LKQPTKSWAAYQALSGEDKKEYFKSKVKCINTLHQHMDLIPDSIEFVISANIVDTIIGDIFLSQ
jgi:fructose-1,6-bisphosphatase